MLASIFPWILYAIACLCTWYVVGHGIAPFWESFLLFVVLFNGGIQGIWAAIGHLGFPSQTAKKIGWKTSPFQTEMGFTNLAIGLGGLACFIYPGWSIPTGFIIGILFLGCFYVHVRERFVHQNKAPLNSGPMLYSTLVVAISILTSITMIIIQHTR